MKRYIITSFNPLCEINEKFFNSIKNYSRKNGAQIVLIPTDINKLSEEHVNNKLILKKQLHLNDNLTISLLPINPEQADPISGLDRLTINGRSYIYSSPKQRLKSVPSPSQDLPRVIMTPGSITKPIKGKTKKSLISNLDHVFGAIVVEIESSSIYHFRQVQADKNGAFIDLGIQYNEDTVSKAQVEAIIPGDYHCGFTDPVVKKVILTALDKYKPKYLVLHDFIDCISINHHIEHKYLTKAQLGNLNDLNSELLFASNELKQLSNKVKNVILVHSNHHEFLDRWVNEGNYIKDTRNHIIGLELALAKSQGKQLTEYCLRKYQDFKNVKFLKSDESFKISKQQIEVGVHGHKGANGSRGSSTSLEKCYQNIILGHSHSPEMLRSAMVVGTSTYLKLSYNEGPSSWMQSMAIVYSNGHKQLVNVIKGKCVI